MKRQIQFVLLIFSLTMTSLAFGQETSGSIGGTIADASNAVLPGVTVSVAGPALMGTKTAVTNDRGEYVIRPLPPGRYEVRTQLGGFVAVVRPGVEVRVNQTASVDFSMAMATMSETTMVTADPPVIDFRNTSRNYTVTSDAIALIPLGTSQQYTDLWVIAPGVRDSLATSGSGVSPSINGAGGTQNKVFVDGIDAGDHVNAGTTTYLNQAVIREVAISTGAFEAQSGFGTGGLMNIVTRSGGNEFGGGASIFLTPKSFNDTNFPGTVPADVETYYPEIHLGGPILRDRLWFFGTEKYLHESRGIFNVSAYRNEVRSHEIYGKLTFQPTSRNNLTYTYQRDRRLDDPSFGTPSFTIDATPQGHFGGYMTGLNWDYQIGDNALVSVLASYFDKPNTTNGRNGDAPRTQFANAAGSIHTTSGNYDRDQTNEQTRPYFAGSFTQSFTAGGSHDVKLSTELYPRTRRLNRLRLNVVEQYRDSAQFGPRQLWRVLTPRPLGGVENDTIDRGYAFAIQDSWRPGRRLTVNGGIRYETNHTDIEGRAEPLLDYESWSPRLGVAFQIDDKTVVKSSVSRIGEKFALDFAFTFFPNTIVFDTAESSKVNGVLDIFTTGAPSAGTTQRNVSRPVPSVIEYVVSVQRQLPGQVAVDLSYVQRKFGHFAEAVDRNLILDIPNKKFIGRVDPRFDSLIDIVDTGRIKRSYRSVQLWANRRLANRWQLNGSYTYALDKQEGEYGYFSAGNAALQFAYGDQASEFFEQERGGRHNLKLSGSYTLPFGVTAGAYFGLFSNTFSYDTYQALPAGTTAPRITLSNGRTVADPLFNPTLLVAPPSERVGRGIGGTKLLNLQLQKTFQMRANQFRVTALVYNVANANARLGYGSSNIASPSYNTLFGVQRPRAGQLSFGWEF
ncbi:MAG TPA: TonB-dependent receptor [Thermoanaerobaculia bacterium]|nr:TonB-dependent receptor [Thermoanaerobaculia bacterium]